MSRPSSGLRERKKAKTRLALQEQALRLFREQGFAETSVFEIAAAADISESTFWRYFATKEAVILDDNIDELFINAIRQQPPELSAFEAVRAAMRVLQEDDSPEATRARERNQLLMAVPELRSAWERKFPEFTQRIAESVAARTSYGPGDFPLRVFAGALVGAWIVSLDVWMEDPSVGLNDRVNEATKLLEAGLPLASRPRERASLRSRGRLRPRGSE